MSEFVVSARKYRPSTFASVVGQQALTQTLKNAISQEHLAHAYLFCGPRGVGKTTCARIFAKTINCLNPTADHEPCNACESCRAFNEGRSMNIHELDAASNNSVDDIRQLIDQVRIPPQIGKYSVYIIDEVHMLSSAAFNAFLKTLEEPPAHARFILATTEKHKILPTILSRCQVYDFNRITVQDTINYLAQIAKKEGVEAETEALNIVAQKADGGMRDALSIYDQLVSFCGQKITYQDALQNLNVMDTEYYFRLTDCFLANKVTDALFIFNEILSKGFDGGNFLSGLGQHLRDVLVSRDAKTLELLETSDSIKQHYQEQAQKCDPQFLYQALQVLNDADIAYRTAKNKRLTVEIMLIRLCQITDAPAPAAGGSRPVLRPVSVGNSQPAPKTQPEAQAPSATASVSSSSSSSSGSSAPRAMGLRAQMQQNQQRAEEKTPSDSPSEGESTSSPQALEQLKALDEDKLVGAWHGFATVTHSPRVQSIFMNTLPEVSEEGILVGVDNDIAQKELEALLPTLVAHMENSLGIKGIRISFYVQEKSAEDKAYTTADQLKLLKSMNPEMEHFMSALDLRVV